VTDDDRGFDLLDAVALGGATLVGFAGSVALLAAYLGVHSMPMVVVGTVLLTVAFVLVARGRMAVARCRGLAKGSWMVLPALLLAAVLLFPGFRYGAGDKDPGIYVLHAQAISDSGQLRIERSEMQMSGVFTQDDTLGTQWRGFEPPGDDTSIVPSFYHLWPALLAASFDLVGFGTLALAVPVLGVLAVLLMFSLARRLAPPWVAGVAALLLATNFMQVWQARYPTTEVLAQVLFLASLLGLVAAVQTRAVPLALLSGTLVTVGFLARGEGVLLVMAALLAAGAAVAADVHRRTALWFGAGVLWLLPLAWYQAYIVAERYTRVNSVPGSTTLLAALVVSAVIAVVGWRWDGISAAWRRLVAVVAREGVSRWIRIVVSVGAVGLFVLGVVRPRLGEHMLLYLGTPIRSYDEESLHRLALFFGWPALVLMVVGFLWAVWARWSAVRTIVVSLSVGFLVLFLYKARNSPQMMWWCRRFIPSAVPAIVLLAAMSLGAVVVLKPQWRRIAMGVVAVVLAFTVVQQTRQSWALRSHDEKGGTHGVALSIAATSGDRRGVFLWESGPCCLSPALLFGSPTWIFGNVDSALLPRERDEWPEFVEQVMAVAGDQPVYLVVDGREEAPDDMPAPLTLSLAKRINGGIPVWEERLDLRPQIAYLSPYDLAMYEVLPGG
jgi:hypothetical protein